MVTTLTADEHEARAVLLGRRYSAWAGAYVDEGFTSSDIPRPWLDAETLEEIHHDEKFTRIQRHVFSEADLG